MCELSEFLKKTLIAAGRKDVFIHYNDGPASGNLKGNGMCKGLDYFSIDSCTRSSSLVTFSRSLKAVGPQTATIRRPRLRPPRRRTRP